MAEIVGSALLSAFFNVLFDKLATEEVKNFLRPKKVINKLLEKLEVSLLSADELLDDAEEKLIYNPRVEIWHNKLKDVVYKASELADKIETEALRRNMERHQPACNITKMFTKLCSNLLCSFDNYVKVEFEGILSSLEHLLSQKDSLGLEPAGTGRSNYSGVQTRLSERATPVADESGFCGREDIKETIIQSLRSGEVGADKVSVIPVIGPGGIGKTTLVQIIYDHPQVKQLFGEVRAWVTVSTEFDLLAIAKKIIEKIVHPSPIKENDDPQEPEKIIEKNAHPSSIKENDDPQELLFKLRDALKGKKFLLILDDVWNEDRDEWDNLKSCLEFGERGSKIIVTTRNTRVALIAAPNQRHHLLPELPEKDCRRLFVKTVFTSNQDWDAHPNLQELAKRIVEKCKGVPLSVKCVGGILRGDRDAEKWERMLKSSMWELLQKNSKNIIPSLWLSYRYLPSHLKRCFAYCSIFPKDYHFQKEKLVQLWMAEGFLKNEAESTMEEVGKQYFEELIYRSLFQRSSGGGDEETIMMHDLVHDLAMYVSGKFCFWMDEDKILRNLPCETRHLSYNLAIEDAKKFQGLSKAKRLHTFVGFKLSWYQELDILKVLEEVTMEGACLRVLSLPFFKIDSLPDSVGKLKHLRYINLSRTSVTKLSDSICTLYNLQMLLLSYCRNLTRLPHNLGRLINLHHLDTRGSPLEEMPPKMFNLKKLHTLTDFVLGKQSGSSIKDLGVLQNLHGRIRVSGLQNVNNVDDALKANLKNKKNLTELALEWKGQSDERDSRHEEKVLEALQPHASLKELIISEYGGTGFPHWVGDSLFSKIETVHLNNCKYGFLPALGRLPSLKELKIKGFHRVETIDDGFCGNDSPFRLLEVLHFEDMPEWNCWSFIEDDKDSVFPRLKELKLECCPKLVGELPNCNTITTLGIQKCINFDFPGNKCRYPSLESLSIKGSCVSLNSFPLDHFPMLNGLELEELECLVELTGYSPAELKELSIVKCPRLEFPGSRRYGLLKTLKIKKCEALMSIRLDYFPKLENLTLRDCENFESFRFAEEPLTLEGFPKFVSFPEGGLPAPNLKKLSIRKCENLRSLPQQMHSLLPSLNNLRVYECGEIEWWPEGGLPSNLESLDIWRCKKLAAQVMHWDLQTLTPCLKKFWIEVCGEELLDSFPPEGLLPTSLTSLYIRNFQRLKTLNIHVFQHLRHLTVHSCHELQCLPEESLPNSLSVLRIFDCPLLKRRYRKETGEGWHKISHIPYVQIKEEV